MIQKNKNGASRHPENSSSVVLDIPNQSSYQPPLIENAVSKEAYIRRLKGLNQKLERLGWMELGIFQSRSQLALHYQ